MNLNDLLASQPPSTPPPYTHGQLLELLIRDGREPYFAAIRRGASARGLALFAIASKYNRFARVEVGALPIEDVITRCGAAAGPALSYSAITMARREMARVRSSGQVPMVTARHLEGGRAGSFDLEVAEGLVPGPGEAS